MDSAPETDAMVLLFSPVADPAVSVGYRDDSDGNWLIVENDMMPSICHPFAWMPLPLPPIGGDA